jgi:hypothetical protein
VDGFEFLVVSVFRYLGVPIDVRAGDEVMI